MSQATQMASALSAAFPGLRVTSTDRSRAQQDALIASGVTRAENSQHLSGTGLDIVLPKGVTSSEVRSFLSDQGVSPGEFIMESGKGPNQGTGAHLHIGLAPKGGQAKGGDRESAGAGGSSYDQAVAARRASDGPSIAGAYQAYKATGKPGGMSPQEATQFEHAVEAGQIMLPRGAELRTKPSVPVLPQSLVDAFNSHRMDDDPDARAEIERSVQAGEVRLPKGASLQAPAPRGAGEMFGMGVRNVMSGAAGLGDIVAAPVNATVNAIGGTNLSTTPFRDVANSAADAMGLATPESNTEKLKSAAIEGATQGIATAGAATPYIGASGVGGAIARGLTEAPLLDAASGAVSGASQESARQAGAGPVGQMAAGLVGGLIPVGAVGAASRLRAPRSLPEVVADTPRSAVIDEQGNLTPHGQEVAARHGVSPDEVHAAYDTPPELAAHASNDQTTPAIAREATNDTPVAAEPTPSPAPPNAPAAAPKAAEDSVPPLPDLPSNTDGSPPATALARVEAGKELGVDYSRGQATKSFDIQDAEQRLKNSNGPAADEMRAFTAKQQAQVKAAVDQFHSAFGDINATAEQRGIEVQDAVRELRDLGKAGVSALYKQARDIGADVAIDTSGIRHAYDRLMVEADVPDQVKNVLTQEAARYGLIGEPVVIDKATGNVTAENGITTTKLDNGQTIKFYGEPKTLGLDNAEEFRQAISKQYQADGGQKLTTVLRRAIDDAVDEAVTKAAENPEQLTGDVGAAFKTARAAHKSQVETFKAKDVIQSIVDWKKGAEDVTSALKPEQVMQKALATTSDLKRVKSVLLSKATPKAKAAWKGIQAHGLAQIFEKATTRNTNAAGEIGEAISGAKLRSAIEAFGPDKLKVLLDPKDFNQLMKLRRVIEDVTIPITGTVNHSNSGNLLMRLAKDMDNQVTAAFAAAGTAIAGPMGTAVGGSIGRTIAPAIKGAREAADAAKTAERATGYTPSAAAADDASIVNGELPKERGAVGKAIDATKARAVRTVKDFIDIYSSPRVIAPVLAASSGERNK